MKYTRLGHYGRRTINRIAGSLFLALILATGLMAQCTQTTTKQKNVILSGWETVTRTPDNLQTMVDTLGDTGIRGVALGFNVPTATAGTYARFDNLAVQANAAWKKEWFASTIITMSAAKSSKLPANFLQIWFCPDTRLAWTNDAAWAKFINNVSVVAFVVKQGGFKGIVIDAEDYLRSNQWIYQASDGTYATACSLARSRGQQMMTAIVQENPDITLLFYWMVSVFFQQAQTANPQATLEAEGNLYVPFINGMLDALPDTATMVDATEHGYYLSAPQFATFAKTMKNDCSRLLAPEHREKYRSKVQVGFGIYEDRFTTTVGDFPPLSGSLTRRWAEIESAALAASDEYIWLYGERGCWAFWDPSMTSYYSLWETIIPGYATATKLAIDLDGTAQNLLDNLHNPTNLASNPGFETANGSLPASWTTTQWAASSGTYSRDATGGINGTAAARATGPTSGCFTQSVSVNGGEVYSVAASAKLSDHGRAYLEVRWLDSGGSYKQAQKSHLSYFPDSVGNWTNAVEYVFVPDGATQLVVNLYTDLPDSTDSCWFDSGQVYKLW